MQQKRNKSQHPKARRRAAEIWYRHRCAECVAACEKAWRAGVKLAVADAVDICRLYRQPPPEWLGEAVAAITKNEMSPLEWKRRHEDMKHLARWDLVTELRTRRYELLEYSKRLKMPPDHRGMTWENCYATVSEELEGTEAAGSADTIKASYQLVQREIKAGRGARFSTAGWRFDPTNDPQALTTKRRE
jgi:hypothetical protein